MPTPSTRRVLALILSATMALTLTSCTKPSTTADSGANLPTAPTQQTETSPPDNSVNATAPNDSEHTEPPTSPEADYSSVQAGEIIQFGAYDWRVLDVQDGMALIITEKIIENRFYDVGRYTWVDSEFRQYLNGELYNSFNSAEQAKIITITNTNPDNPWYGTAGCADTEDNIFLLSIDEVLRYFGDSGKLSSRQPNTGVHWVDDEFNESRIAYHVDDRYNYWYNETSGSWWRLRTPGESVVDVAGVNERGFIFPMGSTVISQIGGIRPALWLQILSQ